MRFGRKVATAAATVATAVLGGVGSAGPAAASRTPLAPTPACQAGELACVDAVVAEQQRHFDPLAAACDHDAIFALSYLRTTQTLRRVLDDDDPAFFADASYVVREDARFSDLYFEAHDAWHEGQRAAVAPAWAVAFSAAENREVSGAGNLLLGINAHVRRDMPFMLAELGLVDEAGRSRKPDHDRANDFLRQVVVVPEAARRFDPTMDDAQVDGTTLDDDAAFRVVVAWREEAWRNAERLAAARTPQERAAVAASIEESARLGAESIKASTAYGPAGSGAARDAYCAVHHGDA